MSYSAASDAIVVSPARREAAYLFAKECALEWLANHGVTDMNTLSDALVTKLDESAVGNDLGMPVRRSVAEEVASEVLQESVDNT